MYDGSTKSLIIMITVVAVILLFFGYITASQEQNIIIMNKNRNFLGFCVIEGVRFTGNVDCERFDNISVGDSCIFEKHVDFYLYKLVSCKKIKEV